MGVSLVVIGVAIVGVCASFMLIGYWGRSIRCSAGASGSWRTDELLVL